MPCSYGPLQRRGAVVAGQTVDEPVGGGGSRDDVAALGGGHAVVLFADQVLQLGAGLDLGATGGLADDGRAAASSLTDPSRITASAHFQDGVRRYRGE
jgi:hypothetical protein